jgi:hypothetical protein
MSTQSQVPKYVIKETLAVYCVVGLSNTFELNYLIMSTEWESVPEANRLSTDMNDMVRNFLNPGNCQQKISECVNNKNKRRRKKYTLPDDLFQT